MFIRFFSWCKKYMLGGEVYRTNQNTPPLDHMMVRKLNSSRHDDIAAAALCLGMLVLALVLGHFHAIGNFGGETDFHGIFTRQAKRILAGEPYTFRFHPPGYTIILAAASLLTDDLFTVAKIISAFAAALMSWIAYLLFKALFNSRVAVVSTLFLILTLIPHSFLATTDVIGTVLMMLAMWAFLRHEVLTFGACLLAGVFAGTAYLVRANSVSVIAGIAFSLLFININQETLKKRFERLALFLCGALLIASPWFLVNWRATGNPVASANHLQIAAYTYLPDEDSVGSSLIEASSKFHSPLDVVLYDPPRFMAKYFRSALFDNLRRFATEGLRFPAYLFIGPGLVLLLMNLSRRRLAFCVIFLCSYLVVSLVGFQIRYYVSLLPFICLLAPYFLLHRDVMSMLGKVPVLKIGVSWLVILIVAVFLVLWVGRTARGIYASEPRHLLAIADFLKQRSAPDDSIIVRKGHLAYWAGLKQVFPLGETPEDFLAKAKEIDARYVVYSDYEASLWPGLGCLNDPDGLPDAFKLIYRHEPTRTLIYEIDKQAKSYESGLKHSQVRWLMIDDAMGF
jgi:hypothetical protein